MAGRAVAVEAEQGRSESHYPLQNAESVTAQSQPVEGRNGSRTKKGGATMETLGVAELLVIRVLAGAVFGPGVLAEVVVRMIGKK